MTEDGNEPTLVANDVIDARKVKISMQALTVFMDLESLGIDDIGDQLRERLARSELISVQERASIRRGKRNYSGKIYRFRDPQRPDLKYTVQLRNGSSVPYLSRTEVSAKT